MSPGAGLWSTPPPLIRTQGHSPLAPSDLRTRFQLGQERIKKRGPSHGRPGRVAPDRRAPRARRVSGCDTVRGWPRAWRPGPREVAADAGGDGIAGCRRHELGPGGRARPARAPVDEEGEADTQGGTEERTGGVEGKREAGRICIDGGP